MACRTERTRFTLSDLIHNATVRAQKAAACELDRDDLTYWNNNVSVCAAHTSEIVDSDVPCYVCALEAAEARVKELTQELRNEKVQHGNWELQAEDEARRADNSEARVKELEAALRKIERNGCDDDAAIARAALSGYPE